MNLWVMIYNDFYVENDLNLILDKKILFKIYFKQP